MFIFVRQNKSRESNAKLAEVNKKEQELNKKIAEFLNIDSQNLSEMTPEEMVQRFENERNYLEADLVGLENETNNMTNRIDQMKKIIEEHEGQSKKIKDKEVIEREKMAGKSQKENRNKSYILLVT